MCSMDPEIGRVLGSKNHNALEVINHSFAHLLTDVALLCFVCAIKVLVVKVTF